MKDALRWSTALLQSNGYVDYFAVNGTRSCAINARQQRLIFALLHFHDWIRGSIRSNQPYDEFASQIVTASGSVASNPPVGWFNQVSDANERIEDISQLFLGQRIQCARCHHHPYEKWSQRDYAQLSAFFSTVQKKGDTEAKESAFASRIGSASGRHPKTGQSLKPAALDGRELDIPAHDDPRQHFADWMVDPENPFSRNLSPTGIGSISWDADWSSRSTTCESPNPPSNPELLDALASELVAQDFDLRTIDTLDLLVANLRHSQ